MPPPASIGWQKSSKERKKKNSLSASETRVNPENELSPHVLVRITLLQVFFYSLDDFLLKNRIHLLRPPIRHLNQPLLSKEFIKDLILPLVRREEQQEILDPTLLEGSSEVVNRLFGKVRAEDDRDNVSRHIWTSPSQALGCSNQRGSRRRRTVLDKMVLCQTLKTTGSHETLGQHDTNGNRYLILLGGRPSVDVL